MREPDAVGGDQRRPRRMLFQMFNRAPGIFQQQVGQVAAKPVSHQHAHYHDILDIRRHGIGRDLPAAHSQPLGQIEQ